MDESNYYDFSAPGASGSSGPLAGVMLPVDDLVGAVVDAISDGGLGNLDSLFSTESDAPLPLDSDEELVETHALGPITSSSGLKGVLLEVIGPYDGIVTQYRYQQSGNSYYTYVNDISPDYPWIFSALLLIVLIHGLYKTIQRCFFR